MRGVLGLIVVLALVPGAALAQGGIYLEGRAGGVILQDADLNDDTGTLASFGITDLEQSFDPGFLVEGAVGYAHDSGLRGEAAFAYRRNDLDELSGRVGGVSASAGVDGDMSAFTTMANLYYDIRFGSKLVPYVGGGLGLAVITYDIEGEDEDDSVLAWQVGAGLAYEATPNMAVTLSYSFLTTAEDPDFDGIEAEYLSHNVMVGFRYTF